MIRDWFKRIRDWFRCSGSGTGFVALDQGLVSLLWIRDWFRCSGSGTGFVALDQGLVSLLWIRDWFRCSGSGTGFVALDQGLVSLLWIRDWFRCSGGHLPAGNVEGKGQIASYSLHMYFKIIIYISYFCSCNNSMYM